MKLESSLPHSQEPATCPCPEPDWPSPCPISHFSKIHFNIILPSKPGSSKWFPPPRFPHHDPVCTCTLPHTCYMSCPSQFSDLKVHYDIYIHTHETFLNRPEAFSSFQNMYRCVSKNWQNKRVISLKSINGLIFCNTAATCFLWNLKFNYYTLFGRNAGFRDLTRACALIRTVQLNITATTVH